MNHIPVLLHEVIACLDPKPGGTYIDATLGDGGHAALLLEHSKPTGKILGIDQDPEQLVIATERLKAYKSRATLVCSRFSRLQEVADQHGFKNVDGILLDLGISSRQLNTDRYGLTFGDTAPLDMRLSDDVPQSAATLLNQGSEVTIGDVLYHFGDRHNSRTLAKKIVQYRRKQPLVVARDLKEALQLWHPGALAPIFQALRIWVNKEYDELTAVLPQATSLLKPGGKLAVISFHSGEDRIVKRFMLRSKEQLTMDKKIVQPSFDEIKQNSRCRSAKLRIATKK